MIRTINNQDDTMMSNSTPTIKNTSTIKEENNAYDYYAEEIVRVMANNNLIIDDETKELEAYIRGWA